MPGHKEKKISDRGARARSLRPRITIDAADPKPVFYIRTHADFLAAITDSQSETPHRSYSLQNSLTFDADHLPYLDTGSSDSDYLWIQEGQTFDGNGFTLTVSPGCEPSNYFDTLLPTLPSLILYVCSEDPATVATVQNVAVHVESGVSLLSLFGYEIANARFYNLSILSETQQYSSNVEMDLLFQYATADVLMDTICVQSTTSITSPSEYYFIFGYPKKGVTITVNNCYIIAPSLAENGYLFYGGYYDDSVFSLSNAYIYLWNQTASPAEGTSALFYGNDDSRCSTVLTDVYVVFNSYTETTSITSPSFVLYNYDNTSSIEYTNVYTNNDTADVYDAEGTQVGAVITDFTWSFPPEFSASSGFDETTPNRLKAFQTFPFNASTYPTFEFLSQMLQSSTTLPNAITNTRQSLQFLYRLTNPNANAPTPKVITNEFLLPRGRSRALNYIPSRNGFVI